MAACRCRGNRDGRARYDCGHFRERTILSFVSKLPPTSLFRRRFNFSVSDFRASAAPTRVRNLPRDRWGLSSRIVSQRGPRDLLACLQTWALTEDCCPNSVVLVASFSQERHRL